MALTNYDRQHLTNKQQQQIQIATTAYDKAKAKGDTAGMEKAAAQAAAVRNAAGYKTDSSGNYTGAYSPTTGSNTNTQTVSKASGTTSNSGTSGGLILPKGGNTYTIGSDYGKQQAQNLGIGQSWVATDGSIWTKEQDGTITVYYKGITYNNAYKPTDLGITGSQQVDAKVPVELVEKTMYDRLNKIENNPELAQYANDGTYWKMYNYIQEQKKQEEYENNLEQFNQNRPEDYQSKYDPQIDALLNEILNREDFSYDVANDPLYQQYANMYRREGDRAMRETMAEVAAGAGGMNTYAVTAAQQANNYYNSQLNDKIPELYQLAYEMYLQDKESKVQDLGLLQNMDATQYARYRDTMSDWKDDRNFALGVYNDAVAQGNWNKNFDYNSMIDNRNFGYSNFWNNKEWNYKDEWKNKQYTDNRADIEYERNQAEKEEAKATIEWYIGKGVSADAIPKDLIERSGLDQTAINQMIANKQAEQGGSGGYTPQPQVKSDLTPPETPPETPTETSTETSTETPTGEPKSIWRKGAENYQTIDETCAGLYEEGGLDAVQAALDEALEMGIIDKTTYMRVYNKYRTM